MKVIVWTVVGLVMWLASTLSLEILRPWIAVGLLALALISMYMAYRQFRRDEGCNRTTKYRSSESCRDMSLKQR